MTYSPSTRPTRTPAMVVWNGISESASAAEAPVIDEHVGVVLRVGREHQRDDLRLVAPAGGEQRTNGPVDHARGEDFLLRHLAFALEEAAGDASRGVRVLAVVDRQRQEVDALARARRTARSDEHHRVAETDDDGTVGLFGQLAGLEGKGLGADLEFARVHRAWSVGSVRSVGSSVAGQSGPSGRGRSAVLVGFVTR